MISFVAFCTDVVGITLTPGQRVLVSVAYDGVEPRDLDGEERELARRIFGDVEIVPPEARAVFVAVCGARGGKSYILGALYSLWRSLVADLSTIAPGELAVALIVAPDMRLARQGLRYALGAAKAAPSIARLITAESTDSFTLRRPDGHFVSVEVLPATRGGSALRGRSLVSAVLDEAAFFRDEQYAVNDAEVFKAVAPRVLPGGLVVIASTPWAEVGLLHSEFIRNHGHPISALAAHAPTLALRDDSRTRLVVDRERERDPDNAAREFDAEFMSSGSGLYFARTALTAATDDTLFPLSAPEPGWTVTIGGDLGLVRDATAFVVLHTRDELTRVAEILELRPESGQPLKLEDVCAAGHALAQRHGTREIIVDHHLLTVARERMPEGVSLTAAPGGQQGKLDAHAQTKDLLNAGRLKIPAEYRRLANQLADITSKPTSGGGISISSPRRGGSHGDIASAFVLACAAAKDRVPFDPELLEFGNAALVAQSRWREEDGRGFG